MERKFKKQQRTIGAIVEIPLNDGYKTYARILDEYFAFYNIYTKEQPSIDEIISTDVLFFAGAYDTAITKGYWLKVGKKLPLEDKLLEVPPFYSQDFLNPDQYTIYKDGDSFPATKEQCIGLEYLSVWKAEAMEKRLNDHYTGQRNEYVEKQKNAELHKFKKTTKQIKLQNIDKEAV